MPRAGHIVFEDAHFAEYAILNESGIDIEYKVYPSREPWWHKMTITHQDIFDAETSTSCGNHQQIFISFRSQLHSNDKNTQCPPINMEQLMKRTTRTVDGHKLSCRVRVLDGAKTLCITNVKTEGEKAASQLQKLPVVISDIRFTGFHVSLFNETHSETRKRR
eukprot:SAG31_NODE_24147_length_488_cov_0.799486_1_plen_162_part_11